MPPRRFNTPPIHLDQAGLTDWVEGALLVEGRDRFSRARLKKSLQRFTGSGGEDLEIRSDLIAEEVRSRRRNAPHSYPYTTDSSDILIDQTVDPRIYEFLLWLSLSRIYRREDRFHEIEQLFNGIVKASMKAYLGDGLAIRFARPPTDGRPTLFSDAVRWLADLLNFPMGGVAPDNIPNDGGVDVVAWRPFRDGKAAYPVLLCQATVQLDKWWLKGTDILPNQWMTWIDLGVHPIKALAVPFAIQRGSRHWDLARRDVSLLLDRTRLCDLTSYDRVDDLERITEWTVAERELVANDS